MLKNNYTYAYPPSYLLVRWEVSRIAAVNFNHPTTVFYHTPSNFHFYDLISVCFTPHETDPHYILQTLYAANYRWFVKKGDKLLTVQSGSIPLCLFNCSSWNFECYGFVFNYFCFKWQKCQCLMLQNDRNLIQYKNLKKILPQKDCAYLHHRWSYSFIINGRLKMRLRKQHNIQETAI
jgi:hypothetical protein